MFDLEKLWESIEHNSAIMKSDLDREDQTSVVRIQQTVHQNGEPRRAQVPSLPLMGDPEIYVTYPDAMPSLARRNYVRDRMQSALTYILEYGQTEGMINEGIYDESDLHMRLRAVFRRVDGIRRRIDKALENYNRHRRRRDMCTLASPRNFPQPQLMGQSLIPTWIRWIREESEQIVNELEEEIQRRGDPDDPFDGTANGTFQPLEHDYRKPLIPLLTEKTHRQGKRKIQKSCSSIPHTAITYDLVVPLQSPVQQQLSETCPRRSFNGTTQERKSDYSQESLPERVMISTETIPHQDNAQLQ